MKSDNKTIATNDSVDTFIDSITSDEQRQDSRRLIKIMRDITGSPPVMWGASIIGFGSYHYKYESGREGDSPKIGFSPRKGKISLYITYDASLYKDELAAMGPHKTSKSCIYIKSLDDVDNEMLTNIIEKAYHSNVYGDAK